MAQEKRNDPDFERHFDVRGRETAYDLSLAAHLGRPTWTTMTRRGRGYR